MRAKFAIPDRMIPHMKFRLGSLFQKNAHSLPRRLYFSGVRRVAGVFSKRQAVYFVDINGTRFKRVVLGDSFEASQAEQALRSAPAAARFPALIQRHENELLLGFVEGRPFNPSQDADRHALAGFFGALYAVGRRGLATDALLQELQTDIGFLRTSGLIDAALARALLERAGELCPAEVQIGLDYVDPVAKNFVVSEGQLFAIDVESLRRDVPLGTGIAKAAVHWLGRDQAPDFIALVERAGDFTLSGQMPFVELCFRVGWTKRKLLQGKHGSIHIELLRELVE